MKLSIKYVTDECGSKVIDDEIQRIFVVSETEHAVIIHLETKLKYPSPESYGTNTMTFRTTARNIAVVRLEEYPQFDMVLAGASRYGMFVCFFHDVKEDAQQICLHECM